MKKNVKRIIPAMIAICVCVVSCTALFVFAGNNREDEQVKLLFTHDIHSRLDEFKTKKGKLVGGVARLKTAIDEKKAENPATFVMDGGDFSMGTLYQSIYEREASEITMLGRLGYDSITLGNHEFDYRAQGIANMLNQAVQNAREDKNLTLPHLVSANIDWSKNHSTQDLLIKEAMDNYGSTPYTIIERDGVKVGIYGVLGEGAQSNAPESGLTFQNIVDTSKEVVKKLKQEDVDMIICLSHSGTDDDVKKSEDEILAKQVPEIDVIISAHTHTTLKEPIVYGDTTIVSTGCYGERLGELDVVPTKDGRWKLEEYKLNHMTSSVKQNPAILEQLDAYKAMINETYLKEFNFTANQTIAQNNVSFTQMDAFAQEVEEDTLGNLIADSYMYAVAKAQGDSYRQIDVAAVPSGVIRDTFQKGTISVADAFNVSALGVGPDKRSGYPLVSVYLTGEELKTMAEIDVSVSTLMPEAQLYVSGMKWTFNPNRLILNRVTDVKLISKEVENITMGKYDNVESIEDTRLYRVVAGLYSAQMLGAVEDQSKGILKVTPKDEHGVIITDFEQHIIRDKNGNELKEWYALASYLASFKPNEGGIPQVPQEYNHIQGRKVAHDTTNIVELLKYPNKVALFLYAAIVISLVFFVLIIRWIVRRHKNRSN